MIEGGIAQISVAILSVMWILFAGLFAIRLRDNYQLY